MSIEEFVHAVRSAPNDDAPRLVFADWFEEQGDLERATLVRTQVERASLPWWDAKAVHLELKERGILAQHRADWMEKLPMTEGVTYGSYARGFVDNVGFETLGRLAANVDALKKAIPFSKITLRWPRLDDRPELQAIEGLQEIVMIGTVMQPEDMEWLAQCPLMSTVEALTINGSGMNEATLEKLVASPYLKQLRALRLPGHNFTDEGMATLMKAELPALRELDLSVPTQDELGSGGRIEPTFAEESAVAIGSWSVLGQLEKLSVTGHQFGANGLKAILSSPHAAGLKSLKLKSLCDWDMETGERPEGTFLVFADANKDMRLEELDIGENELSSEETSAIGEHPALQELKVLHADIMHCSIESFLGDPWFGNELRILSAGDPGDSSLLGAILKAEPKQLHTVHMASQYGWSEVSGVGELLTEGPALPSLLRLDITGASIEEDDLEAFASLKTLPNLVALDISNMWEEECEVDLTDFALSEFYAQLVSFSAISPKDKLPSNDAPHMKIGRWQTFAL